MTVVQTRPRSRFCTPMLVGHVEVTERIEDCLALGFRQVGPGLRSGSWRPRAADP